MGSAALSVVRFMTEKQKDRDGTKAFPPEIQYGLKNAAMCQLLFYNIMALPPSVIPKSLYDVVG
ncbi:hypothetical protein [Kozakia baliensis]|uniref:hypothetical protein n=1 Tax=Kozakia baliensis TaxID=153496 RepID=UPI0004971C64|nr:hypothetical protein [Kozakia baliensis]